MRLLSKKNSAFLVSISISAVTGTLEASTAPEPISPPFITLDTASPTLADGSKSAADVLQAPPPVPFIRFNDLGLVFQDDVNAFSIGPGPAVGDTFALLFSVDRGMFMGKAPDPNLYILGYRYNAFQQATLRQAASDMFMSTELFDVNGLVPTGGKSSASENNVDVTDGGDAGGTDFGLVPGPPVTVDDMNNGSQDNVNGMGGGSGGGPHPMDAATMVYFCLVRNSPSLPDLVPLGGTESGADIYFIDAAGGMNIAVFAPAPVLGLSPLDNINSLLLIRTGMNYTSPFGPGDRVIFSLDANSPTLLQMDLDPSDLLMVDFGGPIQLYADGSQLGLGGNASLNALTFYPTTDIDAAVLRHGIKALVGDLDGDGDVDQADLGIMLAAWGSSGEGDLDGDGDTDQADLGLLLSHWGETE